MIALEKYECALARVAYFHHDFQQEMVAIGEEIGKQTSLSVAAVGRCREVAPFLDAIAAHIKAINDGTLQVGGYVQAGREGLSVSIGDIQAAIEQLKQRNLEMRGILDISRQVTESVNKIAEIAIENKVIAINASVTASKASDKVKGFKVIANEITRISATMAERVGLIVDHAAQAGERMQQIMQNMDESITTTQAALGNIDEAFALLDKIDGTIHEAAIANADMLAENHQLSQKIHTLNDALGAIETTIAQTGEQAARVQSVMDQQASCIANVNRLVPELRSLGEAIAAGSQPAAKPKCLRFCESPITTIDPTWTRMLRETHFATYTCIRLLRYSSDRKLVPYLAETWFLHPDGRTWEFKLKQGVLFHDGSPITARDVKFSFERLMNPALDSPYANLFAIIAGAEEYIAGQTKAVAGIKMVGSQTIQFKLTSSFNFFLSLLALSYCSIIKSDPAIAARQLKPGELVSAGPFRQVPSGSPNLDRLVGNPHFINGRPFLDSLEIVRNVGDVPTALADGRLDLAYNQAAAQADLIRQKKFDGELQYYTSRYCYGLLVNFKRDNYLTRSPELRLALQMAVDKDAIVNQVLGGKAVRADAVLPPDMLDNGGRRFVPYNPAEATRLFERYRAEGKISQPLKVAFRAYPSLPDLKRISAAIESTLGSLGLSAEISHHPNSTSPGGFAADYDLVFLGFLSEIDLYTAVEPFINPEGGDNYFGYNNPEIIAMLRNSIELKSDAERRAHFSAILDKLTKDAFMVPLFFLQAVCATASRTHAVFMSAEESFIPDAVYLSADQAERATLTLDRQLGERYGDAVGRLDRESKAIVESSSQLISIGQTISQLIGRQKSGINQANDLFDSFAESAALLQTTRAAVVDKIRGTTEEAGKSSQAAQIIQAGLTDLANALEGTVRSLSQVKKDIHNMLVIVKDINESNAFIGSIAINAAIISSKTDVRGGDLVKVSESISEQAQRNTENTNTIQQFLDEMAKSVLEHLAFLEALVKKIALASNAVGQSGNVLKKVGPLLTAANQRSSAIEETSGQLASLINEANQSVDLINQEIDRLAVSADGLRFDLDMEQAVADILKDVAWINADVNRFLQAGT
ncbi:MAG: hypothetical protein A2087_11635 [Spirochaetes bacterium GWD1_61_31]|nr:MAG: hypothetical protein A2Y37_14865 [Spirochaetes bacterium GWB1_60_80]OHD30316.1 MAG: hypothetical protein A2004_02860 [Spirochaetes bacterium GWC1_61_12]OHD35851.1 MAG: hypothetical protein A2087_11635 [Spirochaetes bacterium GWD1_61_31]OHD46793.1 MAG: hypothetical protein A2Y35_10805 [Spirochaetes bacterium GWE1_60_18]OHD61245.1 MAG: hypothetical protein A2Y32_13100 [Spirochaetes bacterium GWF1_60_12]